ncbi:low affinity iron permease family protein [Achromobacter kerstersii]|jgi:low affinity Fe/Cu permease|uniref:low affinity iron permease family protein n=1 Tax=Achromobacter kerstersii TaxID=1353890 RepID=UPI0006C3740D|nr:low affinity iron permease family protein [Achromobacter kerstersii]CUJ29637.1 Predicted small integral membrane protein [Achromobacter kerstersii]
MPKPNVKTDDNEQHAKREQPPPAKSHAITRFFDHFAAHVTKWAGSPTAFGAALIAVLIWACTGPAFAYSETWQLVINTGTTIVTFLMVFLIQQNQNKDARALHLKLDELLIALKGADEGLVDAEQLDEDKLLALAAACTARARAQARVDRSKGRRSTSIKGAKKTVRGSLRVRRRVMRVGKTATS